MTVATLGIVVLTAVVLSPALAFGQLAPTAPDSFGPIAGLVGKWAGTSEGQPGSATVERDYERLFGTRFIRVRNRSTYAPQEKNPKGEVHQDEGFFSFDRSRKRIVFRQFHVEGFVNQYVEDAQPASSSIAFVSEAIENIPPGYRAKETYVIHGPDEFEEVFEMAEPGKPFAVYLADAAHARQVIADDSSQRRGMTSGTNPGSSILVSRWREFANF